MFDFINDMDVLIYEMECAVDNLSAVHMTMESDGGMNWQRMCNAVYSACLQLRAINDRMCDRSDLATQEWQQQRKQQRNQTE